MFFHGQGKFDSKAYALNRKTKRRLVHDGNAHGSIVFCGSDPIGWCQYGPKEELPRIDSKTGYRLTSPNAWRITCLFVAPGHRRVGLATFAVKESVRAMKNAGVRAIEAYPVEGERSASSLWSGTPKLFEDAGFSRAGPLGKGSWIYMLQLRP